jgi:hypothetical protein
MGVKLAVSQRQEHRLRMFDNRVLCRIFGPKGKEVEGDWRKLHNEEELRNLYASNQGDEMIGTCSTHGRDEKCIQYFGWKT